MYFEGTGAAFLMNGGTRGSRGIGGQRTNKSPGASASPAAPGYIQGSIEYTPYPVETTANFVNLIYNKAESLIQVTAPATVVCCEGGAGGLNNPGKPAFVRIYLYP